jgi:hypothetical protein
VTPEGSGATSFGDRSEETAAGCGAECGGEGLLSSRPNRTSTTRNTPTQAAIFRIGTTISRAAARYFLGLITLGLMLL